MKRLEPIVDPSLLSGVVPAPDRGGEGAARIGRGILDAERVQRFNDILQTVCPQAPRLIAGQIAAAARRLLYADAEARESGAASIARRMARVEELESVGSDARFAIDAGIAQRIHALIDYVNEADDLIPDDVPVVGQLDDAILIDLLLRDLGPLLADYADFCAFHRELAVRAGLPPEQVRVDIEDWIVARRQEIEAAREQHRDGYAPRGTGRGFRIG